MAASALSIVYLHKIVQGMKKGSRKRKVGGSYLKKTPPTSLFLSLVDQNYIACPVQAFTYKGDWDYFNHFKVFSSSTLGAVFSSQAKSGFH